MSFAIKTLFPGLGAYLKRDNTIPRYFVKGRGEIRLTKADFKAQGGEGAIYVSGSTAYKIYTDPQRTIPQAKILELSVLAQPNIIRPLDVVIDRQNRPVGYSMRHVGRSYALCQLFPRAFRLRNNLTPETTLRLVRKLQEGVKHIHTKGILIVDLNELNFLVAQDFKEVFFIDVDSYQTPSFPASVLMESVRDRHAQTFTVNTDWFSFAVISFQMFVGIHPFKGTYAPLQNLSDKESKLDARMRANVSVLHTGVSVPASCLPFSVIPPNYLDWYRAVFEEGKRLPPPENALATLALPVPVVRHIGNGSLEITEFGNFDSEIIWHDGVITITEKSIYFDGKKYPKPQFDVKVAVTPRQRHLIASYLEASRLRVRDLTIDQDISLDVAVEEFMFSQGQFYIKQQENIFEIEFVEFAQKILLGVRRAANATMKSTRMFEGLAIQSLLGANYASIPAESGVCHQVHLVELDGYRVLEAKLEHRVLMVVGTKQGQYHKLIFRFAGDFSSYDVRVVPDCASTNINFTVLDSGVVLHMTDEDNLEIFSRLKDAASIKVVQDPAIQGDVRLFHVGAQALIARGNTLYKIKLR
jgi:hypothetical protein